MNKTVSPTRTYVAVCSKIGFDGYYFKKFTLPKIIPFAFSFAIGEHDLKMENDSESASWYFLNRLDLTACIEGCFTFEDFINIKDVSLEKQNADISISSKNMLGKSVAEIDKSTKEFMNELNKNFSEELEKAKWERAVNHLAEVTSAYQGLVGTKNVNPYLALAFLDSLLKRYNNGDRTEELYKEIMSCE